MPSPRGALLAQAVALPLAPDSKPLARATLPPYGVAAGMMDVQAESTTGILPRRLARYTRPGWKRSRFRPEALSQSASLRRATDTWRESHSWRAGNRRFDGRHNAGTG
ncbi:hypothetical protein KM043_008406 [Ampulex compressa]|nr:hypothetical protein KM043_008406 [Ampulex compressa]